MSRIFIKNIVKAVGQEVRIAGWVNSIRSHGKIVFLDLRDGTGQAQVVLNKDLAKQFKEIRPEWVIEALGKIAKRPEAMVNLKIPTGQIELLAKEIKILAQAKTLPFPIDTDGYEINEELRFKYRYLDLRRKRLQLNLRMRSQVAQTVRQFLLNRDFVEIETPYITKGTPEGAREFIIPSRLHPGKFYTLPQSPQQFKQLLMVAGFERYFQIARVFRDEDPRADRAYGESTQIDIEASFMNQEEILQLVEEMIIDLVKKVFPQKQISQIPFPRISFDQALKQSRTDKPDIRKNKNDPNELGFCFIVDWPMFEFNKEERRWEPYHHIFTSPRPEDLARLDKNPAKVRSLQYDLVLNGFEVGGGSIRITDPKVQEKVFELAGIPKEEGKSKFHHMLEAFEYGVPPHGGIAIGLDRILISLLGEPNLREVMAFPKTGDGRDLMMSAPSAIEPTQLKAFGLSLIKKSKKLKKGLQNYNCSQKMRTSNL